MFPRLRPSPIPPGRHHRRASVGEPCRRLRLAGDGRHRVPGSSSPPPTRVEVSGRDGDGVAQPPMLSFSGAFLIVVAPNQDLLPVRPTAGGSHPAGHSAPVFSSSRSSAPDLPGAHVLVPGLQIGARGEVGVGAAEEVEADHVQAGPVRPSGTPGRGSIPPAPPPFPGCGGEEGRVKSPCVSTVRSAERPDTGLGTSEPMTVPWLGRPGQRSSHAQDGGQSSRKNAK